MNDSVQMIYTSTCSANPFGRTEARHFRVINKGRLYLMHEPDFKDNAHPRLYRYWETRHGVEHFRKITSTKTRNEIMTAIRIQGFEFPWFAIAGNSHGYKKGDTLVETTA